jgi:CHAT domain-containing protein
VPLVRSLLIVSLFALPIAAAPGVDDAQLTERWVALMERDDVTAFRELAPDSVDRSVAWKSATEIIDRLDCIEIESATTELLTDVTDDRERLLRVTIRGTGVTVGVPHSVEALPHVWFLRAVPAGNEWRIAEVQTAEQRLATAMIAADSDDERRAMLDVDADLARVADLMANDIAEGAAGRRALPLMRFALDLAAAAGGDRAALARTRQMEAKLYRNLGCDDDAVHAAMESLDEALATGDPDTLSGAWFFVAHAHWAKGDIASAIEYFRRSAALAGTMRDPRTAAKALVNISWLESVHGNRSGAIEAANAMAKLSRGIGWIQGQIDALIMRERDEIGLGNHAAARQTGREAYELALRLGRRDRIQMTLLNVGSEAVVRDPDEAIRFLEQVIDAPAIGNYARIMIAEALARKGRVAAAIAAYEQAAALAESNHETDRAALAKVLLSQLVKRDHPELALEIAQRARQLLGPGSTESLRLWDSKAAEASALFALGRTAEAEPLYEEALAEYQAERESAQIAESTNSDFFGEQVSLFHDLVQLKLLRGKTADALRVSELVKASLLDEIQSGERGDVGSRLTPEERAEQQRLEEEITRLNRELFHAASDGKHAATLKKTLAETRNRWESLETSLHSIHAIEHPHPPADPLQSPETLVPDVGSLVLDYVVTESKTILFVLSRDARGDLQIDTHTIDVSSADLQRSVDRFLGRLADASFDYESDARRLYRLLLAPASKSLDGKTVIALVPDGPLWRLPFQALQRSDGQPLIAQCTLFYAPSLTSLRHVSKPESRRPAVLAIGNPRFDRGAAETLRARTRAVLGDLPEAATEAREIAGLYGNERSRALVGREATEGAIKEQAPAYDIVHIAAHAVVDDAQPLYSSIVLASDSGNDGLLEGREITRLHLHARLAVLSACSTAQGQVRPGEGMIALSWAFLIAGCPTVVATQWNVPTESTARLMIDFHRELARGATVAAALRRAQLHLMKDRRYRHPFYWSPFVVVGAGRS